MRTTTLALSGNTLVPARGSSTRQEAAAQSGEPSAPGFDTIRNAPLSIPDGVVHGCQALQAATP